MRRVKHVLSYVLVLSMCFTLFFMPKYVVFADTQTYIPVNYQVMADNDYSSSTIYGFDIADILSVSSNYHYIASYNAFTGTNDNRVTVLKRNTSYFVYIVNSSASYPSSLSLFLNGSSFSGNNIQRIIDGVTYYGRWFNVNTFNNFNFSNEIIVTDNNLMFEKAVYYTFGDGAVDPAPPGPSWGKPYDVEYATRIAGSGLASADNIDRIVWNRAVDTNGNELPIGSRVQIRAIPGKYVGNTANDVLTKTYTDFVLDHSKQLIIVDIIASRGVYETKWSEVVDHFGFFPYSWVPNIQYIDNEYFKMGWIYQIRLQVDDYYSDWTNIYTATGSGASESQTITDSDEISQQLVQDINIVNQLNNTSTVNWYINETTINNSEYTENTNGKPWWAYLLEAILSLFQIGDGEQQTINNTNNLNIDLNDKLNEYNEIEDQQLNNLDTNLEAIEVESDMLENNKFVGSANWVAQQYTRMTNGTVIGSLIGFSLLFGLALIFIGKIR